MAYKLNLFEDVLPAIDRHKLDYFGKLTDDEKKGFAAPVVLRAASSATGDLADWYLMLVNERANINFWDIWEHPELQYKLLASCGHGRSTKHPWIPNAKSKGKTGTLYEFMLRWWPGANDDEVDLLLGQFTHETFKEFVAGSGVDDKEMKEVVGAYERHFGIETKKPARKRKG